MTDCLAVKEAAVVCDGFERVTDGVTEVEYPAQPAFALVAADDIADVRARDEVRAQRVAAFSRFISRAIRLNPGGRGSRQLSLRKDRHSSGGGACKAFRSPRGARVVKPR